MLSVLCHIDCVVCINCVVCIDCVVLNAFVCLCCSRNPWGLFLVVRESAFHLCQILLLKNGALLVNCVVCVLTMCIVSICIVCCMITICIVCFVMSSGRKVHQHPKQRPSSQVVLCPIPYSRFDTSTIQGHQGQVSLWKGCCCSTIARGVFSICHQLS